MVKLGGDSKITFRAPERLKDGFEEVLEERDLSMSEALREHMEWVVSEFDEDLERPGPEHEELAGALQILEEISAPRSRKVSSEIAQTEIAKRLGYEKSIVKNGILEPLRKEGYISVRNGQIWVAPSDPHGEESGPGRVYTGP